MLAGDEGWNLCEQQLAIGGAGEMFTAMGLALERRATDRIAALLELGESSTEMRRGLLAAFGWVSTDCLKGVVKGLLGSTPYRRAVGLACCAMHQVDPGPALTAAVEDADSVLRARAFRAAVELGRIDMLGPAYAALRDGDAEVRFWGANAALAMGDRDASIDVILTFARSESRYGQCALGWLLKSRSIAWCREFLSAMASSAEKSSEMKRRLVGGCGVAGDPHYVPWLIGQMSDDRWSRLAGHAFSTITGVDLAANLLDRQAPKGLDQGPNDDPADQNVAMDKDDALNWPDRQRVEEWWQAHRSAYRPGTRYFVGGEPTRDRCLAVLKDGDQSQRVAAAEYLCVLAPGTRLFPTSAPTWRQQRALAAITYPGS